MKADIKIPIDGAKGGLNDTLFEEDDSVRFQSFKGEESNNMMMSADTTKRSSEAATKEFEESFTKSQDMSEDN